MRDDDLAAAVLAASAPESGGMPPLIGLSAVRRLAVEWGVPPLQVERTALENGVVPVRYQLNLGTIGIAGQLELLLSTVGVCGLGGLGGGVVESLARFGVGRLILVDGDVFEEHNLNRQLFCTETSPGRPKVDEASERVAAVNSSIEVASHHRFIGPDDVTEVFRGADVVIDSSKHVSTALVLRHVPGIDLRIVHLVRDSRGVAYSWTKEVARPEVANGKLMPRVRPSVSAAWGNFFNGSFHGIRALGTPAAFLSAAICSTSSFDAGFCLSFMPAAIAPCTLPTATLSQSQPVSFTNLLASSRSVKPIFFWKISS